MTKYLVTGCAGFVGSQICRALLRDLSATDVVVGVDSMTSFYSADMKHANVASIRDVVPQSGRFNFVRADLGLIDIAQLLDGVDVLFHQAGQAGVRPSWGDEFANYVRQNVIVTQRLLEAARGTPSIRRFVNASSSSVYGDAETFPTAETARPMPRSPYGVTKLAAENLCSLYAANFGVPTVSLRYFTVYGPGQRPDMAFTRLCTSLLTRTPFRLFGDGSQIRDFTYIDDVVRANLLAAHGEHIVPGAVINISGGSSTSLTEVITTIEDLAGQDVPIDRIPIAHGDVHRTGGDSGRAEAMLAWHPTVTLRDGLDQQLNWIKSLDVRLLDQIVAGFGT